MSKAEIMAELAHLSREDLADVRAWLDRVAPHQYVGETFRSKTAIACLRSPHLADGAQAADFKKRVAGARTARRDERRQDPRGLFGNTIDIVTTTIATMLEQGEIPP